MVMSIKPTIYLLTAPYSGVPSKRVDRLICGKPFFALATDLFGAYFNPNSVGCDTNNNINPPSWCPQQRTLALMPLLLS